MEPVTHLMTGAVLARSGFNRKAAYATLAMTLAAEAPDLDTLWSFGGPVAALQHHRGWTHTFLGIPFEAAIVLGLIYLIHRWRTRRNPPAAPLEADRNRPRPAPIRWPLLYGFIVIALLSHILLDWTNNYGVRPFFPFNPRWYSGSFVFIFDPILFLLLLSALIAPVLFGLINSEVGARKPLYRGRGWAIAALIGIAALYEVRILQHQKALQIAQQADYSGAPVSRVFANPHPANPFLWQTIAETPAFYQLAEVDTRTGILTSDSKADVLYKPPTTLFTLVAKQTWLGRAYLDWASWPLVTDEGPDHDGNTTVRFLDLRFYGDPLDPPHDPLAPIGERPLTGAVILNPDRRVLREEMSGHVQH